MHLPFSAKQTGILFGILAAVTYGMNPLFALPLYQYGFDADSVLFLRYLPACILLGIGVAVKREGFLLAKRELIGTLANGLLFSTSSLCLFLSYQLMDAGIASTLLFVYPVLVALITAIGFREKQPIQIWICIFLSLAGVSLLCKTPKGELLNLKGVFFVFMSSLTYAVYLIWMARDKALLAMPPLKLTFYVIFFGMLLYLIRLKFGLNVHGSFVPAAWLNIAGIALFPTVFSLICTTLALQKIGSSVTAILGALEPLTAVFFGVTVFGEILTRRIVVGIFLILLSVVLIAVCKGKNSA